MIFKQQILDNMLQFQEQIINEFLTYSAQKLYAMIYCLKKINLSY